MKIHLIIITLLCCTLSYGQSVTVKGTVSDESGELPGVSIFSKTNPSKGVTTTATGEYEIKVEANSILVYSYLGYTTKEVKVSNQPVQTINVILEENAQLLDEVTVVGYGSQRKVSVVGAISSVNAIELQRGSVTSVSNNLAGRIAGLIGVQSSGEPGSDVSEFWIRGISTFGGGSSALVLIDGIDRGTSGLNDLAPEDIESFSVLKDATATAIYGARGANGVIIINTKRGVESVIKINADVKTSVEWLPRLPQYLRAHDYAKLANEAKAVRGDAILYSPDIFDVLKYKMDPDLFPDVSWKDEILRQYAWSTQANVNISGGGKLARYYMSGYYRTNDAIYKQTGMQRYNSNVRRNQYSFRSNIDVDVTSTTKVTLLLAAKMVDQDYPGIGSTSTIWNAVSNITPMTVPVIYSNGLFPSFGAGNNTSPTILLNETGYRTTNTNTIESTLNFEQKLDFITKGLKLTGLLSFDSYNNHVMSRTKMPDLYMAIDRNWQTGDLLMTKTVVATPMSFWTSSYGTRTVYAESRLNYEKVIDKHHLGALFLYQQKHYQATNRTTELSSIPNKNQGIAGRLTYSFDDIYFLETNFGYNGSENFPKGQRYGLFPSVALGYVISNYKAVQDKFPFLDMLKLRYSFGLVGNDQITSSNVRFPYLTTVEIPASGFYFGDIPSYYAGVTDGQLGSTGLVWESAVKNNWGIDINLLNSISVTIDAFLDKRDNIFMQRGALPGTLGVRSTIYGNVGKMRSWGADGTASYRKKFGDFNVEVRGNFTFTRDKILDYDEVKHRYPYLAMKGMPNGITRGLIALGLFKDEDDVRNSPKQFGEVLPGDIKYQDVNGDGVINSYDIVPIGNARIPKIQYGFAGSVGWKGWDFNIFFRGSGKSDFFYGGTGFYPFAAEKLGNVLTIVNDQKNRWTPAEYSGDPSTENPNARFPRLTYGNNTNNNRASTFWLADASFLRLKTLEIGYSLPKDWLSRIKTQNVRLSVVGDNLYVWDKIKLWDPEQASSNGAVYPLTRSCTFSLQISF